MPIKFTVTREDMLRSKVLDPGWYKMKVTRVWRFSAASSAPEIANTAIPK